VKYSIWTAAAVHLRLSGRNLSVEDGRFNRSGTDNVRVDSSTPTLGCPSPDIGTKRCFSGGVDAVDRHAFLSNDWSSQDDRSTVIEQWEHLLDGEVDAAGIYAERSAEMLGHHRGRFHRLDDSCVREKDVNIGFFFHDQSPSRRDSSVAKSPRRFRFLPVGLNARAGPISRFEPFAWQPFRETSV
jgi:hypothetical protein